mgnify:CR=1 FL=1
MTHSEDGPSKRYRIRLRRTGVPERSGEEAAADIAKEFLERPWHQNVTCTYDKESHSLVLEGENDYDEDGGAFAEEFSDAICAYMQIEDRGEEEIVVESAKEI